MNKEELTMAKKMKEHIKAININDGIICNECGGRIIEADQGFEVCEECGLVFEPIWSKNKDPYEYNMEKAYRKEHREINLMRKQQAKIKRKELWRHQEIGKDVHANLKTYCLKNNLTMKDFATIAIRDALKEAENV